MVPFPLVELPTEKFFKIFAGYNQFFEQEETVYEDNELGIWVHAIIPNNTSTKNTLFVQSWDYGSSDPKCFIYFGEDRIYIGTCECSLNNRELLNYLFNLTR